MHVLGVLHEGSWVLVTLTIRSTYNLLRGLGGSISTVIIGVITALNLQVQSRAVSAGVPIGATLRLLNIYLNLSLSSGGKSVPDASTKRSGSCSSLTVCSGTEQHKNSHHNAMEAIFYVVNGSRYAAVSYSSSEQAASRYTAW